MISNNKRAQPTALEWTRTSTRQKFSASGSNFQSPISKLQSLLPQSANKTRRGHHPWRMYFHPRQPCHSPRQATLTLAANQVVAQVRADESVHAHAIRATNVFARHRNSNALLDGQSQKDWTTKPTKNAKKNIIIFVPFVCFVFQYLSYVGNISRPLDS